MDTLIKDTFIEKADQKILGKNKLFFGAYLNMAQHNVDLILLDIVEKVKRRGIKDYSKDNIVSRLGQTTKDRQKKSSKDKLVLSLTDTEFIRKELARHFPAFEELGQRKDHTLMDKEGKEKRLESVAEQDVIIFAEKLQKALELLDKLRNKYSHFYYKDKFEVDKIFLNSFEGIKRFPDTTDVEIEELRNFVLLKPTQEFEHLGLLFFICMFLERKQAYQFLAQFEEFRGDSPVTIAKRRAFTNYSCRVPRHKLESTQLELDAINELSRCPIEIYDHLSDEDKAKFKTDPVSDDDEPQPDISDMIRHNDRIPDFIMRYFDEVKPFESLRFQVWAGRLRAADYVKETYGMNTLRNIHENLTTYDKLLNVRENEPPKDWIPKLQTTQDKNGDEIPSAIEQFSPHYNIIGNRIAIKFINDEITCHSTISEKKIKLKSANTEAKDKVRYNVEHPVPDAILSTYELQNLFVYNRLSSGGGEKFIKDYINTFRRFCKDVKEGTFQPIEDGETGRELLQKKISTNGYKSLKISHLPDAMRKYLLGKKSKNIKNQALNKIDAKIIETADRLNRSINARNHNGEKLNAGDIATFLAKDIVFLKKRSNSNKQGKPNNDEYNELQRAIAYFGLEKDYLQDHYLKNLNLIGSTHPHPFLHHIKLKKCTGVQHFYEEYLKEKRNWLKAVKNHIRNKPKKMKDKDWKDIINNGDRYNIKIEDEQLEGIENEYGYFLKINTKDGSKRNYLYLNKNENDTQEYAPVILPRGLFNDAIRKIMTGKKYQIEERHVVADFLKTLTDNEAPQTFYQFKRQYEYEYKGSDNIPNFHFEGNAETIRQQLTEKNQKFKNQPFTKTKEHHKRWWRKTYRNEQKIRYIEANDRTIWLIIKDIFVQKSNINDNNKTVYEASLEKWKLCNVGYEVRKTAPWILDESIEMTLKIHDKKVKINAYTKEDDKPIDKPFSIKRYGEFRRLLKDARLPKKDDSGLFHYYPQDEIDWITIERELDYYDKERHKLFNTIHQFEKLLLENKQCRQKLINDMHWYGYINHRKQIETVQEVFGQFLQPTAKQVAELRNKFMHNKIPYAVWLDRRIAADSSEHQYYTAKIVHITIEIYQNLIDTLESEKYD